MLECGLLVRPAVRGASVTTQGASLFQPVRRSRVSTDIVRQIQDLIAAEHLQPGDRLPGERELADALSVSRQSVREALRVLDYLGVVVVRPGEAGTAAAARRQARRHRRVRVVRPWPVRARERPTIFPSPDGRGQGEGW